MVDVNLVKYKDYKKIITYSKFITTTPAHTLPPQHKISSRQLAGNNSTIPPTVQD